MIEPISIYDRAAVDRLRAELKFEPRRLRALRTAFFKKFLGARRRWPSCRPRCAKRFLAGLNSIRWRWPNRVIPNSTGRPNWCSARQAGYLIESVIMRTGTGRVSLCVSSQVGCAAACEFCATGQMGIAKNLSAAEILDQVVLAGERMQTEGRHVRNIVFMGMGEPFHNEETLYDAVAALLSPDLFHHTPGRILISTVGIPDAMVRCARRFPDVNLALSLHSVRQEVRRAIDPARRDLSARQAARGSRGGQSRFRTTPS